MRTTSRAILTLTGILVAGAAGAQDCSPGRDLVTIPEITRQNDGVLRGVVLLADDQRSIAGSATGQPCETQQIRYFSGYAGSLSDDARWPSGGDPLPGPTLRARVGDLVQLTFLNQIDTSNFPNTLDQGEQGKTDGCDVATAERINNPDQTRQILPRNDKYPNCLHGSSTANLHFHGTHTTPSTTGDNVLLYIRPALRQDGGLAPDDAFVAEQFKEFFEWCAANGPPQQWTQMPASWQAKQEELLETYDATAPYKGVPGDLPESMKLWPRNADQIAKGLWPQYSIGAFPYCFSLPAYDPAKVEMGQAPGTHWYHAHKHGSTALNVGNGMAGAFVIEGEYDDALRKFYRATQEHENWGLDEKVLVIQQLETSLNVYSGGDGSVLTVAPLSVNGRLNPVVTMRPNQVQLWRIVNTAHRSFVQFDGFTSRGPDKQSPAWRQIAQDGVQFAWANYQSVGTINAPFNLAAANRADLLVRAPAQEGDYQLQVIQSVSDIPSNPPTTLLTVRVKSDGKTIDPPMDFIQDEADFPPFPPFLADITGPFHLRRELVFDTVPKSGRGGNAMPVHEINGKQFDGHHVDQTMYLDTAEEWTVSNRTTNIAHPFHIHINPFQVVEVFQPNSPSAKDPTSSCYADPLKPATWQPCQPIPPPWIWWDAFAIPTARADTLDTAVCTEVADCPADIQQYTTCSGGTCTVTIPGHFKMRSRFVDFTGQYVLHCHILAHEDRGMMELVQVVEKPVTGYFHH